MENDKLLEKIRDSIEEAIKPIMAKGAAMTPADLDNLTKAVCVIEKIKAIEGNSYDGGYSRRYYDAHHGYSGHSIKDRMIAQLERMIDEAKTEHERQTVNEWIRRLSNN